MVTARSRRGSAKVGGPSCGNEGESAGPAGPEAAQDDPEGSVGEMDDWTPARGEGGELLVQGEVLEKEVATKTPSACRVPGAVMAAPLAPDLEHRAARPRLSSDGVGYC